MDMDLNARCVCLPALHQFNKPLEVVFGIVGTGGGFGMILNGDYGKCLMAHAFNAAVVQIHMSYFHVGGKTVGKHRKAMIV